MTAIGTTIARGLRVGRSARRSGVRLLIGGGLLAAFVVAGIIGPQVAPYDPIELHLVDRLQGPSSTFALGTDEVGRDILSRLISGLLPALLAGIVAIMVAAAAGTAIGVTAGYFGGKYETLSMRLMDLLLAWPTIFLALAIVLVVGPGRLNVILAIAIAETPVFARLVRSVTITLLHGEHVTAARSMGASDRRLMWVHILPFAITPLIVQLAISTPQAVVAEASLSFLGLGAQPPEASLGAMLSSAQDYLSNTPTYTIFPAVTIGFLVLSLTLLADGLQDRLDPTRRTARAASAPAP